MATHNVGLSQVLRYFGYAAMVCLFLAPVTTCVDIWKKGRVGDYSGFPYLCTFLNCLAWALYGRLPPVEFSTLLVSINVIGCVLEVSYFALYICYAEDKRWTLRRYLPIPICFTAVMVVVLKLFHDKMRDILVGTFCGVFGVAMYIAPLTNANCVIRAQSVEFMPFFLSLFTFINGFVWFAYAWTTNAVYMAIPSGIGALSGAVQLTIFAIFNRTVTPSPETEHLIQHTREQTADAEEAAAQGLTDVEEQ